MQAGPYRIPSEMLAFELNADTRCKVPASLARMTRRPWFPTRMSNLDSSDHRTLFHFETVHFKWALAHRTRRRFWPCFTHGFLLHDRALVASADGTADCVYRQWFLEVFLGPFSNVNDRIMLMSDAVSSEGPKTKGIQQKSSALSLTHRDFSSFSYSFDDVMHCRWWDLQSLCNLTLRNVVFYIYIYAFSRRFYPKRLTVHSGYKHFFYQYVCSLELNPQPFALLTQCSTTEPQEQFLKYSTIFLRSLSQIGEPLPIFPSWETLPL